MDTTRKKMNKMNIKKGDRVKVLTGKDRGKEGTVERAMPSLNKVIVGGVNIVKRHQKAARGHQAGIIEKPAPLQVSNVMLICTECGQPTRVGHDRRAIGANQNKLRLVRMCKKCDKPITEPVRR